MHTPRLHQGKRIISVPGPHTHTWLTTTHCCLPATTSVKTRGKAGQLLLSASVHTWPVNQSRCLYRSNTVWLNQHSYYLLDAVIQNQLPCTIYLHIQVLQRQEVMRLMWFRDKSRTGCSRSHRRLSATSEIISVHTLGFIHNFIYKWQKKKGI